ncbi:MAG: hypothetical protein ACLRMJ_03660 [Alistipes finegoldii]
MPTDMSVDYSGCEKTVYLESPDGRYGFCVKRPLGGQRLHPLRQGENPAQRRRAGLRTDPDRYMIKGIRSSMIVERVTGNDASVLPVTEYISG